MKKCFLIIVLGLAAMACSLTSSPSPPAGAAPVLISTITPSPTRTSAAAGCVVTAQALNLRACRGVGCKVIGWLTRGQPLIIDQTSGGWLAVTTAGGQHGWINSAYCEKDITP